jgi:putative DNA primase/helicase
MQSNKNIPTIVMMHGVGANGKSVFLKVMGRLLAAESTVWSSIKSLETDKFSLAGLVGKNILIDADTEAKDVIMDGMLKKLSENCPFEVRQIYKSPSTINLHITPWLACNNFQALPDASAGFARRFQPLPFHNQISEADQDLKLLEKHFCSWSVLFNAII